VQEYLSLVRLQVLTPLSLLINIATVFICSMVVKPSIGGISKRYPTSISPRPALIAIYVLAIYVGQVGYCVLLVLASKPETKRTLVKGVGQALVFANWIMAAWAIAWVLEAFLLSTILQGALLVLLLYSNIALLIYHPPDGSRPVDTALIHAPLRAFLILPLSLLFPYSLFITLHLAYTWPSPDYSAHPWSGLAVVLGTNLLGFAVVLLRRDIVWCVAATWICVSIWTQRPKPVPVTATVVLFTALHPLGLVASSLYTWLYERGRIALPLDGGGEPHHRGQNHRGAGEEEGPREIDTEAWS
jgi:hypothetical protein